MSGAARTWPLEPAWLAASAVTAAAYGLDVAVLRAPSRGRGPKPPEHARDPKKIALFLAVALSDAPYAHLGRHLDLHKDTVSSHCADVRRLCADDRRTEDHVEALLVLAQSRLDAASPRRLRSEDEATLFSVVMALHAKVDALIGAMDRLKSHPTGSDEAGLHPTPGDDNETVIIFDRNARASA